MNVKVEKLSKNSPVSDKEKAVFSKAVDDEHEVKDSLGRTIVMSRPSPRTDIYFPTLFTREESVNLMFMMGVKPYAYVKAIIDGSGKRVSIDSLIKKSDLDCLIDMLGHEGRQAISLGYAKYFAQEELKNQTEIDDEIKKLHLR